MSTAKTAMPAGAALSPFDAADYLRTPAEIAEFLQAVFEDYDGDTRVIVKALGAVARAQGMPNVAKASGMSREGLYQALSGKGNPSFDTVFKVMHAVGIGLKPTPITTMAELIKPKRRRVKLGAARGWSSQKTEGFSAEEPVTEAVRKRASKFVGRNSDTGEFRGTPGRKRA